MAAIACIAGADHDPASIARMAEAQGDIAPGAPQIARRPGAALALRGGPDLADANAIQHHAGSGTTVVMDGYLANREALLETLGATPTTDAALASQAFLRWGEDFADRLEGEFAVVVWEERTGKLTCARDHQGLRPIYYRHESDRLIVTTTIKAIVQAQPNAPRANRGFMAEVMANQWYAPDETIWHGIGRLPGGHVLRFVGGAVSVRRYWSPPSGPLIRHARDEDYLAEYRDVLRTCVAQAARTTAPLAVEVSGGLDSSAVFAVAHSLDQEGRLPAPSLQGYTLSAQSDSAADESRYVDAMRRQCDRAIAAVPLARPGAEWFARYARETWDLPPYPNAAMSLDMDHRLVADGCRVKLTGIGGDQWLDGSRRYYREALASRDWRAFRSSLRADLRDLGVLPAAELVARAALRPAAPGWLLRAARRSDGETFFAPDWMAPDLREELAARRERYEATLPQDEEERRRFRIHAFPYLGIGLDMTAQLYARSGCEARHPLLSRRFVEYAARLPQNMLLRGGTTKFIHRRALEGLLPAEIAHRRSKAEFGEVFSGHDKMAAAEVSRALQTGFAELVDVRGLSRLLHEYQAASIDRSPYWELWGTYAIAAAYVARDIGTSTNEAG